MRRFEQCLLKYQDTAYLQSDSASAASRYYVAVVHWLLLKDETAARTHVTGALAKMGKSGALYSLVRTLSFVLQFSSNISM